MKKGTINTIVDYLYKRPGSRFSFVFALSPRGEDRGEVEDSRGKNVWTRGNPIRGDMCR
jgi:hypothetical protein